MKTHNNITRRDFLRSGVAAGCVLALGGCSLSPTPDIEPMRGFNVHPYMGSLLNIQMQALNEIRADWIRTTLGITTDSAGSYVTVSRANVLGLISDFHLTSINKREWPDMVEAVIRRYQTIRYFQILNEPEVFFDISNTEYVLDYLRPAHDLIRNKFPSIKIVSAAPIGQPSGIRDFTAMSNAGADDYCDFRAVHIYFEDALTSPWSAFRLATQKPIMITETGTRQPEKHLDWWYNQIPKMQQVLNTEYIFYYALLEYQSSAGFGMITGALDSRGNIVPTPGSALYDYLRNNS